jgi:hypothetical protein
MLALSLDASQALLGSRRLPDRRGAGIVEAWVTL